MTIALVGVNCRELFTLLVTFFGKDTGIDPFSFLDAAPKVPVPLDLTDTELEEEGGGDGSSAAEGSGVAFFFPFCATFNCSYFRGDSVLFVYHFSRSSFHPGSPFAAGSTINLHQHSGTCPCHLYEISRSPTLEFGGIR